MHRYDSVVAAITVSVLGILAVYVMMISDNSVPNYFVALVTLLAFIVAAYLWHVAWAATMERRLCVVRAQLRAQDRAMEDMRADMLILSAAPHLRRI